MFSQTMILIAVVVLVMLSVGGLAYALMFASVSNEATVAKRLEAVTDRQRVTQERKAANEQSNRRRNIQSALKDFEARQEAKLKQINTPPLTARLQQAGLKWTVRTFVIISIITGLVVGLGVFIGTKNVFVTGGAAFVAGFGFPRWFVGFRRARRMKAFLEELPNAVDVIVRGIRSGLPLGDCLRIISTEAREPVRSEFRAIVETQQLGIPIGEACMKLYERMPVQEANFFGIVIMIQQKAGGNLSETLNNLSRVLRERKKMKAKIRAVSQEAKASAMIIGALPVAVCTMVSIVSPNYIATLFTTTIGNILLGGSLIYMFIGIMVMRKMINFDI